MESITDYANFLIDPEGRVINWNAGAQRFKGYTAVEILGQNFAHIYSGEDRAKGKPNWLELWP